MERKTGILAGAAVWLIVIYRKAISPWIGPCCRFNPSCSEYAIIALRTHGFFGGTLLSAWRLLRCNPFCRHGEDPVPDRIFNSHSGKGCSRGSQYYEI